MKRRKFLETLSYAIGTLVVSSCVPNLNVTPVTGSVSGSCITGSLSSSTTNFVTTGGSGLVADISNTAFVHNLNYPND